MKLKAWHIGLLVVLVAVALYFLMGTREGLDTPPATPPAPGTTPPATPPPTTPATPPVTPPPTTGATPPAMTPLPPGPTGTTGGASMTPSIPAPATLPSTAAPGGSSYNLTCTASPVSGMTGSVGMPETPPIWDVNQPPPGHNSKHGYTLY